MLSTRVYCTLSSRYLSSVYSSWGWNFKELVRKKHRFTRGWAEVQTAEYTHRMAMDTIWRKFHHDGKISPAWWGWLVHGPPPFHSIYHHEQSFGVCKLQLRGQIHSPYFSSTPICTLWFWAFLILFKYWTDWPDLGSNFLPYFEYLYTVKKAFQYSRPQPGCHLSNSPWAGIMTSLFLPRESLVSGDGNIEKFFFTV